MTPTPVSPDAFVTVDPAAARAWRDAARALDPVDPRALYDLATQRALRDAVRAAAPDAYDALIAAVRRRLDASPHLAVVRGITWDAADRFIVAMNAGFGPIRSGLYHPPRTQIVSRLDVRTELAGERGPMRGAERLHSDNGYRTEPARLLTMVCVRPDPGGGGATRVVTAAEIGEAIEARLGAEALAWYRATPLPWRVTDPRGARYTAGVDEIQAKLGPGRRLDPRGQGVVERPVLAGDDILWSRRIIDDGFRLLGETPTAEVTARLDALGALVERLPTVHEVALAADDFMIADNLRTLHTRAPLTEVYAESSRLMLRCWVHDPIVGGGPYGVTAG